MARRRCFLPVARHLLYHERQRGGCPGRTITVLCFTVAIVVVIIIIFDVVDVFQVYYGVYHQKFHYNAHPISTTSTTTSSFLSTATVRDDDDVIHSQKAKNSFTSTNG